MIKYTDCGRIEITSCESSFADGRAATRAAGRQAGRQEKREEGRKEGRKEGRRASERLRFISPIPLCSSPFRSSRPSPGFVVSIQLSE